MDLILNNLKIPIESDTTKTYRATAATKLKIAPHAIFIKKILSKDLDLRDKSQFIYTLAVVVTVADEYTNRQNFTIYNEYIPAPKQPVHRHDRPIIVGFGPAGMFAALELISYGLKPIIFERGKQIHERSLDVEHFIKKRELHPESNIQFGEGGAGSFSDGKLFSRRNKNTSYINRVLKTFVQFGAPAEIEYISKPHLGTDVLCTIVKNIRLHILEHGGDIHYNAAMTDLLVTDSKAVGIVINKEEEYLSSQIYIALGHSARTTTKMLFEHGVAMEQRPIAVGVRIEHPVATINHMRYGDKYQNMHTLGAATYSLNYTNKPIKRGIYTFCMCPGGEVVNASSSQGELVLNGMSYSKRDSDFSNAALVANCHVTDYGSDHPLAGIGFQENIERKSFHAGGKSWSIPAQNLMDFLGKTTDTPLHQTSCKLGITPADMHDILPGFAIEHLQAAFNKWQQDVPTYISSQAILMAAETRTSSPVRIIRENYESISMKNLYPIGEGAGYTGGITSSAADAIRAVEHLLSSANS